MSDFKNVQNAMEKQFNKMIKESDNLFTLNLEKNELWNIYLESFPKGTNEIFRKRREHDCSCCRNFINNFGDVVTIKDNKIVSIWDFEFNDDVYSNSVKALSKHIHTKEIKDVFVSKQTQIGTIQNHEISDSGVITWEHFNILLPKMFVNNNSDSIATHKGKYRDIKNVFKRSLEEISKESVLTVLELINQGSLYKGDEWKNILNDFSKCQEEYEKLSSLEKNNYLWVKAVTIGSVIGKIRNHSIGTLLTNISEGVELDVAVKKYEVIVAPTNYKRPKPIYTKRMLEDAKKKIEELGYLDSLQRRFAILEDVSINNVLFANKDSVKKLQTNNVFDDLEKDIKINPKTFNKLEEIKIDDFIKNVLPTTKQLEVYLENKHANNMVSLIAPFKADCKTMFKWNNNFSWAYAGNITDSDIKKNVKNAGGNVNGVLRFSIQWNDLNEHNKDDFDAHCKEPCGNEIYFSNMNNYNTSGQLDVDITRPRINIPAVENIVWTNKSKMHKGTYKFFVRNYAYRGGTGGFRAEIEFNGEIYKFDYNKSLRQGEDVQVAEVMFDGESFKIKSILASDVSSKTIWNNKTNNFVPVSTLMYSPNYWDEQKGIGNKHYFFMLKDCVNEETPNGFFNEFLNNELVTHRKVFEALGTKMKVETVTNQLSGLGFSSTQKNNLVVQVTGETKRLLKIIM